MAWQHAFSQASTHKNFDDKRLLDDIIVIRNDDFYDIKNDIINL